ncbi:translation initiation factor eIF5 [Saccharomycopsis crataegensis]|uniref:Translation initiation factor eIF5 n=1 Tax=Saccharomycopsis crataegensis TaxID=43959 RepID=A0AAV5QMI5_9ASCO|nr:translation initiation factor eIF5 [Saccharomycopsis crataegensis]
MSFINICRDNTDVFYRYKMPPIQSKIEGRGNGIKTLIVNLTDVAKALARPPSYLVKYFGFELGAQTSMSESTDRYLVNGQHDSAKLQDTLDGFISKFVLCASCKNPETDIIVKKGDILIRECKACGKITDIDPRSKLSSYIIKNPPKKIAKGTAAANVGGSTISDLVDDNKKETKGEAVEGQDEIEAEASALLKKKVDLKDDDWSVDMSAEAIAERAKKLSLEDGSAAVSTNAKYEQFGEWLVSFGDDKSKLPSDVEIFKKMSELKIDHDEETCQILGQVLFDDNIVEEIKKHEQFLDKLLETEDHEKAFLGGIERLLGLEKPALIAKMPKILYELYDADLVSEEAIKKFGTTVSKKYVGDKKVSKKVRKAAKPFLKWLETADEESSDEEDDE